MRLHHLRVTAFGPFAEPTQVDFDALSDASVFLLCGDTGAGKSTVLDAVCFALYGDVPGDRSAAKQLRSHHAADGVPPEVVLEATLSSRRFRFTRSPSWSRPKKRGAGLTTQQASVLVEERLPGGEWVLRSNRLDEAGHLVGELLGMTLTQFSQVVLLPQGQFDTFLRATSEERHAVLTRLFRTSRFDDVERWLTDRRTSLRRAGEQHRQGVVQRLHRLSEATSVDLPSWADDAARAAESGDLERWCEDLLAATAAASTEASSRAADAERDRLAAATAYDEGRVTAGLQTRHRDAVRLRERLEAGAEEDAADRARSDAARRAAAVRPLAALAGDARRAADLAAAAAEEAVAAVADVVEAGAASDDLAARAREATERAAVGREFLPRARELGRVRVRVAALDTRLTDLREQVSSAAADAAALPARVGALAAEAGRLRDVAATHTASAHRVAVLGVRLTTFATRTELEHQVREAQSRYDAQREVTLSVREQLVAVHEQRLHGMAAELAAAMAVGDDCPVCGSADHPTPARAAAGAPTRADEQALSALRDDAEVVLEGHRDGLRGYRHRLAAVGDELAGQTEAATLTELEAARAAHAAATQARELLPTTEADLTAAREAHTGAAERLAALQTDVRVTEEQLASARTSAADLVAALVELLGRDGDADDLARLVRADERAASQLAAARDALVERTRATEQAARTLGGAADAAIEAGFDDLDAAIAAVLDDPDRQAVEARITARERAAATVRVALDDPDVRRAASEPEPDLPALVRRRDATHADLTRAAALSERADDVARRTTTGVAAVRDAVAGWAPVRADATVVGALAELAEGKGAENARQVRLSAYVLASRLAQVVAAANERLTRMSDDRYELEHTDRRGVGERRGGLSLVVLDHWTDERRDPVTLSGGETFVVSLALALGLADVVTGETGGVRMETLFVDEGFGSLDSDTLELVMDTLDQLREGGRVVGVVSHVPELRTRIPTQLLVRKTRSGSSVQLRHGSG